MPENIFPSESQGVGDLLGYLREEGQPTSGGDFGQPSNRSDRLIGAGLGGVASGISSVAGGIADIKTGKEMLKTGRLEADAAVKDLNRLKEVQPSLDTPSTYYETVKNAYDRSLMDRRLDDINRSLSTTIDAASSFGSRGLGAIPTATESAMRSQEAVALTQQQLQTDALSQLAKAEERAIGRKEARSDRDIGYAYDAKRAGEAKEFYGQQAKSRGISSLIGGVARAGVGAATLGFGVGKKGVKITSGEFDHESNPLHVINDRGEKTHELTGGEYVFNPEQSEELLRLAKSGDSKLHKYLYDLLSKFEKNAREL